MPVIDNAIYVDGRRAAEPGSLDQTFTRLRECAAGAPDAFCWIGLVDPGKDEIAAVAAEFDLHPLAVEDTVHAHQRPKIERYGDVEFVVLRPARYDDATESVTIGEIHLFIGPSFVITVRHAAEPDLAAVRKRLEGDPALLRIGPYAVLYAIMDRIVDDYVPVLDGLQRDIDEIETQVFGGDSAVSKRIYTLSREVIEFQRAVAPLRDLFGDIQEQVEEKEVTLDVELGRRLRDVADHSTRVLERIDGFRQLLSNILSVNAALVGQRQNEEMARLTEAGYRQNEQMKRVSSWAAIAFAPSLVAGIYGMNFAHMPELEWPFGYPMAVGLMIVTSAVLYVIFKRRGWL